MILRLFLSAISPGDTDQFLRLFEEDVAPAFAAHPDCLGIELLMAVEPGLGGLIEGCALSRWTSAEAMEAALEAADIVESQVRIRELLRREPIRKVYRRMAEG